MWAWVGGGEGKGGEGRGGEESGRGAHDMCFSICHSEKNENGRQNTLGVRLPASPRRPNGRRPKNAAEYGRKAHQPAPKSS